MAYIVSGGLHSIEEVLCVPHVRLGLIDDYDLGQYNVFFQLFSNDPEFQQRLEQAWKNLDRFTAKIIAKQPPVKGDRLLPQLRK
jgi:hypothetical protein